MHRMLRVPSLGAQHVRYVRTATTLACLALQALAHAQLNLSEAERLARNLNPIMRVAEADVQAAKAAKGSMLAPFNPSFDLRLYAGRRELTVMDMGWGLDMLDGFGSGGNAMLSWNLYSGGSRSAAGEVANAEIGMAESRARQAWLDLQLEVRLEFAMGSKLQEVVRATEASLEAAKELERISEQMFEAGKLPEAFVFGARADRLRAERELAVAKAELAGALARIVACCGAEITGGRIGEWDVPMEVPESLEKALQIAYTRSPEVLMLQRQADYWAARARMVRGSSLPQVSFNAATDRIFGGAAMGDRGSQFGLFLSFPLSDGGLRRSEIATARSKQREYESQVAVAKNRIRAELTAEWERWLAAPAGLRAAMAQVQAAEEAYRIARLRYEEGLAIRAEVSQALADLQEARTSLAEANEYQRSAWSKLRKAIGG